MAKPYGIKGMTDEELRLKMLAEEAAKAKAAPTNNNLFRDSLIFNCGFIDDEYNNFMK